MTLRALEAVSTPAVGLRRIPPRRDETPQLVHSMGKHTDFAWWRRSATPDGPASGTDAATRVRSPRQRTDAGTRVGPKGRRVVQPALLSALLALVVATVGTAADVVLRRPDGAPVEILVAGESESVSAVAVELQDYLQRMTGAEIAIGRHEKGARLRDHTIVLGLAADGVTADITPRARELEAEGFLLDATGGHVVVIGADEPGLWFGAYALLERLGCRFYFPGELGENVPRKETLSLAECRDIEAPDFVHRNVWWAYGGRPGWQRSLYSDWQRKTKMGGVAASMGHNLYRIIPQAKYGETHPEYFPVWDGRRHIPAANENHGWQPCTSNPEVVEVAIEAAIKYFDERTNAYSFSLSPNDGYGWCECPDCVAQDPPEYRKQANRGKGRRVLIFANKVAEGLAKKHPDKYVAWYAYAGAVEPSEDIKAHPNVVTVIAHYGWCGCNIHAIEDPNCKLNQKFLEIMDGWSKVADRIFIREYFTTLVSPTDVIARVAGAYSLAQDMPYFKAHNVIGVNSESVPDYGAAALNYYLAAKLMWDADQELEALLSDWYAGMYGPAAEKMREYTETIVNTARARGCRGSFFTKEDLDGLGGKLDEAAALAETDKQKGRVAMAREAFDYMALMRGYSLKPTKELREKINGMMADIEQGQRLSIDFVRHKAAMGRRPSIAAKAAEQFAGMKMQPVSTEPMPAEAAKGALSVRGVHGHAILLKRGEKLTGNVSVRRLGRYLAPTVWVLLDPAGKKVAEGVASIEEEAAVEYAGEQEGVHVLVTNSGSNACRARLDHQYVCLVGRNPHFLGATPWFYFYVLPGVEQASLSLRTDAPGETGKLIVRDPAGNVVAEAETGAEQSKVTIDLPVTAETTGKVWSARITKASKGTCEDLMFSLGPGVAPCIATEPARLMVPVP